MKIGIIGPANLRELPYLKLYDQILIDKKIEFDIINWNKYGEEEDYISKKYTYQKSIDNNTGILNKGIEYLKFQRYAYNLIKKNKYDKLIILCPQTILFIYYYIINKYKNKYILDIRDYSYVNKFKLFYKLIVNNSYCTIISSKGYLEWLPKSTKYKIVHNINSELIPSKKQAQYNRSYQMKDIITIGTIGSIRDYEGNKYVIEQVHNSKKLEKKFFGKGIDEEQLRQYCEKNKINKCYFYGRYSPDEEQELYKKVDFINVYTEDLNNKGAITLLPNRLYNACINYKPLIARENTFLGEIVKKYNLGITVDLNRDNLEKEIECYVKNICMETYERNVESFINNVIKENEQVKKVIKQFIQ